MNCKDCGKDMGDRDNIPPICDDCFAERWITMEPKP